MADSSERKHRRLDDGGGESAGGDVSSAVAVAGGAACDAPRAVQASPTLQARSPFAPLSPPRLLGTIACARARAQQQ